MASCLGMSLRGAISQKKNLLELRPRRPLGRSLRYAVPARRHFSRDDGPLLDDLKTTLQRIIPDKRKKLARIKEHADTKIANVNVAHVIGGMRALPAMLWEGSVLDAQEGIRFHGHSIADCQSRLPKGRSGSAMLPEAMFWLLLTGEMPSAAQIRQLSKELARRAFPGRLPDSIQALIQSFPTKTHPMIIFSSVLTALSRTSIFAADYERGMQKSQYWDVMYEDCLDLIARLPQIVAYIHHTTSRDPSQPGFSLEINPEQDWSFNFAKMLNRGGKGDVHFQDMLRLYLALHADHEGGNVSAHATHLVGSALSDPYLSYSAGLQGLAGPLHGLAAQEVLRFMLAMQAKVGQSPSAEDVTAHLWSVLKSGVVIPGFGHAVLRKPDPRFTALLDFGSNIPSIATDPLFRLVQLTSEVAPRVLTEHGKTKNPFPNVDCISAPLFHHFGYKEPHFTTLVFGVSRAMGTLTQLIWDRALGLPIERPKSINLEGLAKLAQIAD